MEPARAELTAEEILGERELITELTIPLWSTEALLDLAKLFWPKLDALGPNRAGATATLGRRAVIATGATTTGRGATRTVLVCPMADWTAELILGWREARILAIKSDWEVLVLLDAETPLETAWSSTPARGPSQPTGTFLISTAPFCSLVSCLKPSGPAS